MVNLGVFIFIITGFETQHWRNPAIACTFAQDATVFVHASHFADAFVARANRLTALKALQDHFSSIGGMTRNTLQPKTESRMVNNGFKMLKKQNPA